MVEGLFVPVRRATWPPLLRRWAVLLILLLPVAALAAHQMEMMRRRFPPSDLPVFARAAWAAREGQPIYDVTDAHGWHYLYPPLLAIALRLFADPPPGSGQPPLVPLPITALLGCLASVACLAGGVETLARALEETSPELAARIGPAGSLRWWALRLVPVAVCLPGIYETIDRAQVGLLLVALFGAMTAAALRGRRLWGGFWLAVTICLKVIPGLLLLYPLRQRDRRWFAGCIVGLLIGLVLVPAVVVGPANTLRYSREYVAEVLQPGSQGGERAQILADEVLSVTGSHTQSLLLLAHRACSGFTNVKPAPPTARERRLAWGMGAVLTLLLLLAAGRRRVEEPHQPAVFLGTLIVLTLLVSPVCHDHYFCLWIPLVITCFAAHLRQRAALASHLRAALLLALLFVSTAVPLVPACEPLREAGISVFGGLLLWSAGVWLLAGSRRVSGNVIERRITDAPEEAGE